MARPRRDFLPPAGHFRNGRWSGADGISAVQAGWRAKFAAGSTKFSGNPGLKADCGDVLFAQRRRDGLETAAKLILGRPAEADAEEGFRHVEPVAGTDIGAMAVEQAGVEGIEV